MCRMRFVHFGPRDSGTRTGRAEQDRSARLLQTIAFFHNGVGIIDLKAKVRWKVGFWQILLQKYWVSERAKLIQDRTLMRNVDPKTHSSGLAFVARFAFRPLGSDFATISARAYLV
jgi:hypothetical protein